MNAPIASPLASDGLSVWVTLKTITTSRDTHVVERKKWYFRASQAGVIVGGPLPPQATQARASLAESQPALWDVTAETSSGGGGGATQRSARGELSPRSLVSTLFPPPPPLTHTHTHTHTQTQTQTPPTQTIRNPNPPPPPPPPLPPRVLRVTDSAFSPEHVRIFLSPPAAGATEVGGHAPRGDLILACSGARTYFQLGQGTRSSGPIPIERNAVIKLGACSLAVSDLCTGMETPAERSGWLSGGGSGSGSAAGARGRAAIETASRTRPPQDPEDACYICYETGAGDVGDDPLAPSPCACGKVVHRSCLQRWIMTRQSRVCSICRKPLPLDLTVEAPFAVLTVVRHVRGLHWRGQKEYVATFRRLGQAGVGGFRVLTLGAAASCDVCIGDHSVSAIHARLSFSSPVPDAAGGVTSAARGQFLLEDLQSSAGTYLRVPPNAHFRLPLPPKPAPDALTSAVPALYTFKIGRTLLTLRIQFVAGQGRPPVTSALLGVLANNAGGVARAIRARLGGAAAPTTSASAAVARPPTSIAEMNRFAIGPVPTAAPLPIVRRVIPVVPNSPLAIQQNVVVNNNAANAVVGAAGGNMGDMDVEGEEDEEMVG